MRGWIVNIWNKCFLETQLIRLGFGCEMLNFWVNSEEIGARGQILTLLSRYRRLIPILRGISYKFHIGWWHFMCWFIVRIDRASSWSAKIYSWWRRAVVTWTLGTMLVVILSEARGRCWRDATFCNHVSVFWAIC